MVRGGVGGDGGGPQLAGRSAACPGAGWPSPPSTPRWPRHWRTSAPPASASCWPWPAASWRAWSWRGAGAGGSRPGPWRGHRRGGDGARAAALRAAGSTATPRSRRCRATSPATATTSSTTSARSPRTTSTPPSSLAARGRRGRRAAARLRGLAGELHRRRPVHRPADRRRDPARPRAPSACPSWSAPSSTPGPTHVLNQGIVWNPGTGAADRYTKWHPVPYGEYIPFRRFFNGKNFGRLALIPRDMLAGTRDRAAQHRGRPGRRRHLLRRRLRRRALRAARQRRPAGRPCRPATPPSSTPPRSTSSSRSAGCGPSSSAAGSWSPRPTGSRAIIAPDGTVVDRAGIRTRDVLVRAGRARHGDHARRTARRVDRTACLTLTILGLLLHAGPVSSEAAPAADRELPTPGRSRVGRARRGIGTGTTRGLRAAQ